MAWLVRSVVAFVPVRTLDRSLLLRSLEIYETHRIDYAEAYLVASAEWAGVTDVASFDRSIDRVPNENSYRALTTAHVRAVLREQQKPTRRLLTRHLRW